MRSCSSAPKRKRRESERQRERETQRQRARDVCARVCVWDQDLGDGAHSFGPALSEHQSLVHVQVLRGFDEAEVHCGLVSCS